MRVCSRVARSLAALAFFLTVSLSAAEINVSAAASLTDALKVIQTNYEGTSPDRIVLNLGASSMLARQIQSGAPVDLFLSADEAQMNGLEKAGLLVAGTRQSALGNALVIVVPSDSTLRVSSAKDLAKASFVRLALAEPAAVPAGVYAKQYLTKIGIWDLVSAKVVPTENVRATLAAVETGNVEAGIVYRTDALVSKKVRVAFEVPANEGPAISYPFAVVKGAPNEAAARRFLEYLFSGAATEVFARYGFVPPARGKS
jgi:molybdate transport system substrate-binding protein